MSQSEPISLRPLVEHIQEVIDQVSDADVPDHLEVDRTKVIQTLSAARDTVRALCFTGDPDTELPVMGMGEND